MPVFLLTALAICLLPLALFVVLPDIVPVHRVMQAQVFGLLGLAVFIGLFSSFILSVNAYFALTTLIIPIIPFFSSYLPPLGGEMLMVVPEAGLALFFMIILIQFFKENKASLTKVNFFILAWFVLNTAFLPFSHDLARSLPRYILGVVLASLYLATLHNIILGKNKSFKFALTIFLLANFGFMLFGIGITGLTAGWRSVLDLFYSRMGEAVSTGQFGSNAFAGYMMLFLPLLFWALAIKPGYCPIPRIISWPLFLMGIFIVIFSVSRGNLISLAVLLALWAYYLLTHRPGFNSVFVLGFLSIVLYATISEIDLIQLIIGRFMGEQQFSIQTFLDHSMQNIRVLLIETAFAIFQDNWLTGVGFGNIQTEIARRTGVQFDSHNLAMNILAEQGGLISLLLLAAFVYISYQVWRCLKTKKSDEAWLALSIYAGLVLYLLRSVITGGDLVGGEFMGSHRACWLFTTGALIDYIAHTPGSVFADPPNDGSSGGVAGSPRAWPRMGPDPIAPEHGRQ